VAIAYQDWIAALVHSSGFEPEQTEPAPMCHQQALMSSPKIRATDFLALIEANGRPQGDGVASLRDCAAAAKRRAVLSPFRLPAKTGIVGI
jgi:hypothetical protein